MLQLVDLGARGIKLTQILEKLKVKSLMTRLAEFLKDSIDLKW